MRRIAKPGHPPPELLGASDAPGAAQVRLDVAARQLCQALDGVADPAARAAIVNDRFATRLHAAAARTVLHGEQRGLCAFCEGRVTAASHAQSPTAETNMRIAHWQPRSVCPERALDWQNLFGSCDTKHRTSDGRHCDDFQRENAPPSGAPTPAQADYSGWMKLSSSGKLLPLPHAPTFVAAVIKLFNLNAGALCSARNQLVQGLHNGAPPRGSPHRRARLELRLVALTSATHPPPYVTAMRLWLEREIRAEGSG